MGRKNSNSKCGSRHKGSESLIIKSPIDCCDYLSLVLPNGLKALLISTCKHESDLDFGRINPKTGILVQVEEFNQKFIGLPPSGEEGSDESGKGDSDEEEDWEPCSKRSKVIPATTWDHLPDADPDRHACVCLTVGVGSIHNPKDFPGLAHLCEHVVVSLGSKKYPRALELYQHIQHCEGNWNACTFGAHTSYMFQMDLGLSGYDRFTTAVDMLGDAVGFANMDHKLIKAEVQTVDSEYSLKEVHDGSRIWQLLCTTAKEGHPATAFSCGNSASLKRSDLATKLCEWKKRHYAANYMTLVIKAALPLDDLAEIVRNSFSGIPSSILPKPNEVIQKKFGNPFDTDDFCRFYACIPSFERHLALLTWVLPPEFINDHCTKPLLYLQQFFGPDSNLNAYLRSKHWAYYVIFTNLTSTELGLELFCSPFSIIIGLTEVGVEQICDVLKAVFSYFAKISETGADERVFNNMRRIGANKFHYEPSTRDLWSIVKLSCCMQGLEDQKYILTSKKLVTDFDVDSIEECISWITPRNMNVIVCSKNLEETVGERFTEKWYKTPYTVLDLNEKFYKELENVGIYKEFRDVDQDNPFIVKNLNCAFEDQDVPEEKVGKCLLKNQKACVNYMKAQLCVKGTLPLGVSGLELWSPVSEQQEVGRVLFQIWGLIFHDLLRKSFHQAGIAGIYLECDVVGDRLCYALSGPSENQTVLILKILQSFDQMEKSLQKSDFLDFQATLVQNSTNSNLDSKAVSIGLSRYTSFMEHTLAEETLRAAASMDFVDLKRFIGTYKEQMKIYVKLVGCFSERHGLDVADYLNGMKYGALRNSGIRRWDQNRAMMLPLGDRCLRVKANNFNTHYSEVVNQYQFGVLDEESKDLLDTLSLILQPCAFHQLRTVEKLSYVAHVNSWHYFGASGLFITVSPQTNHHTTGYVDERIDEFLANFRRKFGCYKAAFPKRSCACPASITQKEHATLLEMFDNYLLPNGRKFRKLSIQVVGYPDKTKSTEPIEPQHLAHKYKPAQPGNQSIPYSFLKIAYDLPGNYTYDPSGYFVSHIESFKESMKAYPKND